MKTKIKIFLIFILCANTLFAQFINIPDPTFKAKLVASAANTDLDFEISVAEATAYTGTLNLISSSLTDVTGLEYFINLRQLDLRFNQLTNLDVSANTALIQLLCDANQLTTLDVSANIALTDLRCSQNQITSLDISANPALYFFQAAQNNLTSLNVANGNNSNFNHINFNVTDNPSLACIQIDDNFTPPSSWEKDATASYSTDCNATASTVDNTFNNTISVYPNPIQNKLNISLPIEQEIKSIQVFTLLGEKVKQTTATIINFSALAKGIYFVKIENTEGKIAVRKIIKE